MQIDNTIKTVLEKIQSQVKKEFGTELSQEELLEIVDSQFKVIPAAIENKDTVKLDKLGKFLIKETRAKALKDK